MDGWRLEQRLSWKDVQTMQWEFIAAIVLAIPIILLPIAFIWYINSGNPHNIIHKPRKKGENELPETQ
jgi:hypothetical protein